MLTEAERSRVKRVHEDYGVIVEGEVVFCVFKVKKTDKITGTWKTTNKTGSEETPSTAAPTTTPTQTHYSDSKHIPKNK